MHLPTGMEAFDLQSIGKRVHSCKNVSESAVVTIFVSETVSFHAHEQLSLAIVTSELHVHNHI